MQITETILAVVTSTTKQPFHSAVICIHPRKLHTEYQPRFASLASMRIQIIAYNACLINGIFIYIPPRITTTKFPPPPTYHRAPAGIDISGPEKTHPEKSTLNYLCMHDRRHCLDLTYCNCRTKCIRSTNNTTQTVTPNPQHRRRRQHRRRHHAPTIYIDQSNPSNNCKYFDFEVVVFWWWDSPVQNVSLR